MLYKSFWSSSHFCSFLLLIFFLYLFKTKSFYFFWCRQTVQCLEWKLLAELRTISLCDSDLFLHSYNASHRKLSESPAISFCSGTESERSFYDNVDVESECRDKILPSRFLMPPTLKNSLVNRSKSFQEPAQSRNFLSPRSNIKLRQNLTNSIDDRIELISNRSSVSPVGSTRSETNVDCSLIRSCPADSQTRNLVQPSCSCDKKRNGPFYVKILRRVRKLSLQWPKCKRIHRG